MYCPIEIWQQRHANRVRWQPFFYFSLPQSLQLATISWILVFGGPLVWGQDSSNSNKPNEVATTAAEPTTLATPSDTIEFKTGGSLTGTIIHRGVKSEDNKKSYLVFETVTGGRLKIDEAQLKPTVARSESVEFTEYMQRFSQLADDPIAHRELYQWCEAQPRGKTFFADQIQFHLQRIVELDPNDREARQKLGMIEVNGRWVSELQNYQSRGYVYDRRWVPQTRQVVNRQLEAEEALIGEGKSMFVKWNRNLNRAAIDLSRELIEILAKHPQMNLVVVEYIRERNPPDDLRLLMLEAVATQINIEAFGNLVYFAVEDPSDNVRDRVISLLEQPAYQRFRPQIANVIASNYLPHARNEYVNRAASILQSLGDWSVVMPLIDCLKTRHKVANPNPAKPGGIAAGNGGMNIGGGSGPTELTVTVTNDGCLNTLRRMTQQDFGFDLLQWRRWYAAQVTNTTASIRRDD